jgi:hypothetical protein
MRQVYEQRELTRCGCPWLNPSADPPEFAASQWRKSNGRIRREVSHFNRLRYFHRMRRVLITLMIADANFVDRKNPD